MDAMEPFSGEPFISADPKTITDFEVSAEIVVRKGPMDDADPLAFEARAVVRPARQPGLTAKIGEGISHDQARMDGFLHRGNGREFYRGRGPWVRGYVVAFYDPAFRYGGRADYSRGTEIEPGIDCLHGSTIHFAVPAQVAKTFSLVPWRTPEEVEASPILRRMAWSETSPACISIPGGPPPPIAATTGILRPTSTPLRRKIRASRK